VRSDGKSHDYHDELVMSAGLFIKWFWGLPARLDDGACIIMDNASYYTSLSQSFPRQSDTVLRCERGAMNRPSTQSVVTKKSNIGG
jgi:hypothetical protein